MNEQLTPFEQFEESQHRAFNYDYDAHLEDDTDLRFASPFVRNNGTAAGVEALRISLARG